MRPINNVVDITNYVMLETGHPVHAFDLKNVETDSIVVRNAAAGEKMTLLNGNEIALTENDVLITNGKTPLALAGIMGGLESGISENTRTVLLEVAAFDPITIRKSARRLGISTDASYRFERGVDSENLAVVIERLGCLLEELAEGTAASEVFDVGSPRENVRIHLRKWYVDRILGTVVPLNRIETILASLGFKLKETGDGWIVECPPHRFDIYQEIDLIEEIGRIYGYEHIKGVLPRILPLGGGKPDSLKRSEKLRNLMEAHGFDEILTYGFINPETIEKLDKEQEYVQLRNPLSLDMAAMRPSIIYGLLESASYNYRRQNKDLRFYEIGKVFDAEPISERTVIGFLSTGRKNPDDYTDDRRTDFYSMKGVVVDLFYYLGLENDFRPSTEKFLEKRAAADVYVAGQKVGYFGVFNTELADGLYDMKTCEVFVGQLDLNRIEEIRNGSKKPVTKISPFPRVFRDLSFLVPLGMTYDRIEAAINNAETKDVAEIAVADVYRGKGIPEGYSSLTITVSFESFSGTLTDERVNRSVSRIIDAVGKLGATLRG